MMVVMSAASASTGAAQAGGAPAPPPEPCVLLGGDGSAPVKIKQSDAKKIQEDTGEAPEDLEDADLAESMKELGVQSLPLTDEDRKSLGLPPQGAPAAPPAAPATPTPAAPAAAAPSAAPAAPAPPAPPAPPAAASPLEAQLQQLAALKEKGLITPEDYEAKKKQLLGI